MPSLASIIMGITELRSQDKNYLTAEGICPYTPKKLVGQTERSCILCTLTAVLSLAALCSCTGLDVE